MKNKELVKKLPCFRKLDMFSVLNPLNFTYDFLFSYVMYIFKIHVYKMLPMKTIGLVIFIAFSFIGRGFTQNNEGAFSEKLLFVKNNESIEIENVSIDIKVVGSVAITTFDLVFRNPNNRILEGELHFPLGEGQSVTRFAMDVNGKLREAVPVAKEKGQQVFEEIVNRKVDPGLLEKTIGNNYKARVYPIPANGTKHIVIAYEQEIKPSKDGFTYVLPLNFKNKIAQFSITIEVLKSDAKPTFEKNELDNFVFEKWQEFYKASLKESNFKANSTIIFNIPVQKNTQTVLTGIGQKLKNERYFYGYVQPELQKRPKKLPSKITLLWDVSSSNVTQNKERILQLLENYFTKLNTISVQFVTFSNEIHTDEIIEINQGNWAALKTKIEQLTYDGGTQLGCLDLKKYTTDELLLVTDGLSNFGKNELTLSNVPLYVINQNQSADHAYLNYISASTGGNYINLLRQTNEQALEIVSNQAFQFISATYNPTELSDVFPTIPTLVNREFTFSGKLMKNNTNITLNYGFGKEITQTITLCIDSINNEYSGISERIWAVKKINELDIQFEKNKTTIAELGKQFGIVTRNTSLIILETLEDYLRYSIEPPVEFQQEFATQMHLRKQEQTNRTQEQLEQCVKDFQNRLNWYHKEYNPSPKIGGTWVTQKGNSITLQGGVIQGAVYDALTNEPIRNANVLIGTTGNGVSTDGNGNFSLVLPKNISTLVIKASGIQTKTIQVSADKIVVWMEKMKYKPSKEKLVGFLPPVIVEREVAYDMVESKDQEGEVIYEVSENFNVSNAPQNSRVNADGERELDAIKLKKKESNTNSVQNNGAIKLATWNPETPYLTKIKEATEGEMYSVYLTQKEVYGNSPSFFIDVADYFFAKNKKTEGLRILSNLAEISQQNHQILRVLAHRLEQLNYTNYAIYVFEEVLRIRREEPQSYRDLAAVYAADGQYQRAIDTIYNVVLKSWNDRFPEIGVITTEEMNAFIAKANQQKQTLNLEKMDKRLIAHIPMDIRVVLNWDTDNCDIDLWVTDPHGEKCYYSHNQTNIGGAISSDFTGGYGPEEFIIKHAIPGKYLVQANYYGSTSQTLMGPTTIQLDLYTRFMDLTEKKETVTLRLTQNKEILKIAEFNFK